MLTRTIDLDSKAYGALQGEKITVREPENMADCLALVQNGEADVVARFRESIVRAQNNLARTAAGSILKKEGDKAKALKSLQEKIDGYKYAERAEGTGEAKPKGPKTAKGKQNTVAASSGNKLFTKCAEDATFLARMMKQGIVDQAEFDAWMTARTAAEAEAAAAKAAPATEAAK